MNHSVFLGESPGGSESPRHLETLTSNSGGTFQPLSSYPPTTTYYSTSSTYFGNEISSHHNLQTVRLPSIASSLSGVGDLSSTIIKEHPAAVQADQMNSYMEYFVEQSDSGQVDSNVGEEVIVDGVDELLDDDQLLEGSHLDDGGMGRYSHMASHSSRPTRRSTMNKRKQQISLEHEADIDLDDLLVGTSTAEHSRVRSLSPDNDPSTKYRSEMSRERRAAAARNRYQRMSEHERKMYNQRRRLKALGIDPNTMTDGSSQDQIKETIRMANAKKAEAARYHRMTPEEKREYNARRTESFRKRREEEEILLSTPAGSISAEALQKAQQIMVRNARKAESARLRYQRMTPSQRKDYNIRRAQSKKTRSKSDTRENSVSGSSIGNDSFSDPANLSLNTSFSSEPPANILEGGRADVPPPPAKDPTDEIFQQMEREVMKRTKQAKMVLERRHPSSQPESSRFQEIIAPESLMLSEVTADRSYQQQNQMMIDEKSLHDMLVSGRDANGMAVELRTTDGRKITEESELRLAAEEEKQITRNYRDLAQGQTIIIAPCESVSHMEGKDGLFDHRDANSMHMTGGGSSDGYEMIPRPYDRDGYGSRLDGMDDNDPNLMSLAQRHAMAKAKRAERARIRYRNMQPELRQAQNARRADLLRKARARDEELVQMAESRDISTLAPDLQRQIQDAQQRRARRAEQARNKYHRMTSEERRQYNAMRDAQRRQRKRQIELNKDGRGSMERQDLDLDHHLNEPSGSNSISPNNETLEERIIYNDYDMYGEGIHNWDQ